jgi:hypothetical protein
MDMRIRVTIAFSINAEIESAITVASFRESSQVTGILHKYSEQLLFFSIDHVAVVDISPNCCERMEQL